MLSLCSGFFNLREQCFIIKVWISLNWELNEIQIWDNKYSVNEIVAELDLYLDGPVAELGFQVWSLGQRK